MIYILLSLVALGVIAAIAGYFHNRKRQQAVEPGEITGIPEAGTASEGCCGQHEFCERDSLLAAAGKAIEYYDDEELDRFKGMPADAYTENDADQFREILYTLREAEVAGWLRSLQLRAINLPDTLRGEALLIVGERRTH